MSNTTHLQGKYGRQILTLEHFPKYNYRVALPAGSYPVELNSPQLQGSSSREALTLENPIPVYYRVSLPSGTYPVDIEYEPPTG